MSTSKTSAVRQRLIEDIQARQLGKASQTSHVRSCRRFAAFLKACPSSATPEDIRRFQHHLARSDLSILTRNQIMTGVKFLYRVTLRRPEVELPDLARRAADDGMSPTEIKKAIRDWKADTYRV